MKQALAMRIGMIGMGLCVGLGTGVGGAAAVEPAERGAGGEPTVVSLGDSFMSGEGGRWNGNAYQTQTSSGAYADGASDRGWMTYRDSFDRPVNGNAKQNSPAACHRSDTSIVNTIAAAMDWTGINLACSGAETEQVTSAEFRGEAPQVKRLKKVANDPAVDIKAVVISIGGNDLKFSNLLWSCMQIGLTHDCSANVDSTGGGKINGTKRLTDLGDETTVKITQTLDAVTKVMRDAGYEDGSYRFIYNGAPKLFAAAPERIPATPGWLGDYSDSPGVPFHDATVKWSNDVAVPLINDVMRRGARAAANRHIEFLDLADVFKGHELSSTHTHQYRKSERQLGASSEWVVALDPHYVRSTATGSTRLQESFHPNAFGQQVIGRCVTDVIVGGPGASEYRCEGVPGALAAEVTRR